VDAIVSNTIVSIKITLCNMESISRPYFDLDVYLFTINNKITYIQKKKKSYKKIY